MFPQLNEYGPKFEGLPSKQLMHLKDDELLNEFGIVSDVDKMYCHDSTDWHAVPYSIAFITAVCLGTCCCSWQEFGSTSVWLLILYSQES